METPENSPEPQMEQPKAQRRIRPISAQMALVIFLSFFIASLLIIGFNHMSSKKLASSKMQLEVYAQLQGFAAEVNKDFYRLAESATMLGRVLSVSLQGQELRRDEVVGILWDTKGKLPQVRAVFSMWDPDAIEGLDNEHLGGRGADQNGRFKPFVTVRDGEAVVEALVGNDREDFYQLPEMTLKTAISEPKRSYNEGVATYTARITAPISSQGRFYGVVGFEVDLDKYSQGLRALGLPQEATLQIFSNSGTIVADATNVANVGRDLKNVHDARWRPLLDITQAGMELVEMDEKADVYRCQIPILTDNNSTPWSLVLLMEEDVLMEELLAMQLRMTLITFVLMLLGMGGSVYYVNRLTRPFKRLSLVAHQIALGDVSGSLEVPENSLEVQKLGHSIAEIMSAFQKIALFAQHVGEGRLNEEFSPLSSKDSLGHALLDMREKLKSAKALELERKHETDIRNWETRGVAMFSDILRQSNDDLRELGFKVCRELVDYLGANQAGMYVYQENEFAEKYLELTAAFAYDRRKYNKQRIAVGEGLVGTCLVEKNTIHLRKVPEAYIRIGSGLGGAKPRALLIVPMKMEQQVLGVLEVASFRPFEPEHLRFVEVVAGNVATTLANSRVAQQTKLLLDKFKAQSEELSEQEEEMRQNLEELQATQEESKRRENELTAFSQAINNTLVRAEFDRKGRCREVNDKFLSLLGYSYHEATEMSLLDFFPQEERPGLERSWQAVVHEDEAFRGEFYINARNGQRHWWLVSLTPVVNEEGYTTKVLMLGNDISETKAKELETSEILKTLDKDLLRLELNTKGRVVELNEKAGQLANAHPGVPFEELFEARGHDLAKGQFQVALDGMMADFETRLLAQHGPPIPAVVTLSPLHDIEGKVLKVMMVARDISSRHSLSAALDAARAEVDKLRHELERLKDQGRA